MRSLRVLGLVVGLVVVLLGAAIAVVPRAHNFLGQYGPEMAGRMSETFSSAPAAPVTNLNDVTQLQTDFNAATGQPRLILLFSPT